MLQRLNDYRQLLAAVAAGVALYLYGVGHFALSSYYRPFAVAPSDAGVTQATLVAFAVGGLAFVFGSVAVYAVSAWAVRRYLRRASTNRQFHKRQAVGFIGGLALSALGVAVLKSLFVGGVVVFVIGAAAVFTSAVLQWTEGPAKTDRTSLMSLGAVVLVASSWAYFAAVTLTSERLAQRVIQDGGFDRESFWEMTTRMTLGLEVVPAEVGGNHCAVVIAYDGDHAWTMVSPGDTVEIRRVPRDDITVRYATRRSSGPSQPRPCWRDQ